MYTRQITSALLEEACSCIGAQKPDNLMNDAEPNNFKVSNWSSHKVTHI